MNKFTNKAEKSRIYVELLEAEVDYKRLSAAGSLKEYPMINKSLKEISIILERVGFNMNLDNINVEPIKEKGQVDFAIQLTKEIREAPEEVKSLIDKKLQLVNSIAQVKYPINYYINKVWWRFQVKSALILVRAIIMVIYWFDCKCLNNGKNTKKKEILDTYPVIIAQ
ncbi:hypothetical protein Ami103574_02645 [Aminipila butyrica]|uniref:Uncharacterized protein n=1 Tax=Aminipila butyrica TaxID=433296 RepID=A0A858BT70_9FIRM|nr:hypothetical protein [Aminipila butyrica]QIB68278.1 hypothetical protein Ami103574_02645 [Aminipila butyrica]